MTTGETTGGGGEPPCPPQPPVVPPAPVPQAPALGAPAATGRDPAPRARAGPPRAGKTAYFFERYALLIAFIGVDLLQHLEQDLGVFGTAAKSQNLAGGQQAYIVILSMALLIPLLCGEFDLSVGRSPGSRRSAPRSR